MFSLMIQRPKSPLACDVQPRMSIVESTLTEEPSPDPPPKLKFANGKPLPEIVRFDVQLDRPRQTFFSGDVVSGEVRIHLAEYLTVKGIIVRFVGEAYVNVPSEDELPAPWDIRRITRLRHAFRKNRVRPTGGGTGGTKANRAGDNGVTPAKASFTSPDTEQPPETNGCGPAAANPAPQQVKQPSKTTTKPKPAGKPPDPNSGFRSSEKYFEHKIYVFGHKYSSVKESLWPGCHAFPFQYTLPTKLPTSFHGRFGYVRYFCEASLERAWQPSVRRRAYFSVSAAVDVNLDAKNDSSAGGQRTSNQCFFCCHAGTVVVEASIRRRGYVPGETILVSADVTNMSSHAVSSTSAKLLQVVTYHSSKGFRHREDLVLIAEARRGKVVSGESATWESVPISVPPLPASFHVTECCKVLDVAYRVDFTVEMEGGLEPLVIPMPIVIGTVPLQRAFPALLQPDPLITGSPLTRMTNLKYKGFPAVFSMPCISGPRPLEHYFHREVPRKPEDGVRVLVPGESFAPRYVCYRNRDQDYPKPGDLEEPLTVEPPPPRRSRASSLQPAEVARPHSGYRNAHSSSQIAFQPQPLHEPIHRTLAQLKAEHALASPSRSLQLTPTHSLLSPTRLSSIPDHETAFDTPRETDRTSPLMRELLESPTWPRSGSAHHLPRAASSTSDQLWSTLPEVAGDQAPAPATAPANITSHF